MKFGATFGYGIDDGVGFPDYLLGGARAAEESGFESVWIGEHVLFPKHDARYPYTPDGEIPQPPETAFPDPLTALAFVAGATTTLRLGTGVLVLPQRNAFLLAKEAATLDRLSRGRLELGVGIGWMREESEALGIPFEHRAARTDEHIDVMRRVWREPRPDINGRFTRAEQVAIYPKPAQPDGPPIHIGGNSPHAARRAGRIGDGFYPVVASGDDLRPLVTTMRDAAEAAGRDPDQIEVTAGCFALIGDIGPDAYDTVRQLEAAGADRLVLYRMLDLDIDSLRRSLDMFATRVISRY